MALRATKGKKTRGAVGRAPSPADRALAGPQQAGSGPHLQRNGSPKRLSTRHLGLRLALYRLPAGSNG